MPPNTRVQNISPSFFNRLRQLHHFIMRGSVGNKINHRQAVNQDKLAANCGTHTFDNFHWQTHAIFIAATPSIAAFICMGDQKLIKEIPLRAHNFHAIIACLLGA